MLLGMAYFAIEFSIPVFDNARPAVVAAFAVFLGATIAFNGGLARKYGVAPPWPPMLFFLVSPPSRSISCRTCRGSRWPA